MHIFTTLVDYTRLNHDVEWRVLFDQKGIGIDPERILGMRGLANLLIKGAADRRNIL